MIKVPTLVSPGWVSEQILSKMKNLCILDASWHLPIFKRDQQEEYLQEHIPGAQFFDIEKCARPSEDTQKLSHTLPTADFFAEYVGNLGIDNESHVVVYENNAKFGAFSAPRAWWMFRIFGHAKISIMEGGLPLWIKEGRKTTDKIPLTERSVFQASFNADLFKTFGDVERNLEERKFQVMDARPEGRFQGIQPEPRQGVESGHMPNSFNVPFPKMMEEKDGTLKFKSPDQLQKTFEAAGLDMSKPITASCGSGVSACILALGAHLAGMEGVAVFDGAWEEYYLKMKEINPENIVKG
ncbi:3-mercaptopyruvate sulfurtransferase-like isoform X2 [Asterias amurensis]